MKSLGGLLRKYINENGYTIYNVANRANINRTTLQKVLSDDRSASDDLINKLLPVLKLSPAEEAEVKKAFEISKSGETLYKQRLYIKEMIESMASLDRFFHSEDRTDSAAVSMPDSGKNGLPVRGVHSVERLLYSCMSRECRCSNPEILISAPGSLPALNSLFIHDLLFSSCSGSIRLRHITPLIRSSAYAPSPHGAPVVNLEILSSILPFTLSRAFNYRVYSFYRNQLLIDSIQYAFPYFIVFSDMAVLLSCDGNTALPLWDSAVTNYLRDLFLTALKQSFPLISTYASSAEVLENLIAIDLTPRPFRTIEYQPCLTSFLTAELVRKYARPDIPGREQLIARTCYRIQQLVHMKERSCIFSKDGLARFAEDGTISELPSSCILPFEIPDRIRLLKSLYLACQEDSMFLRLADSITFPLPRHMCFALRQEHSIDFSCYDSHGADYNYIHITEPILVEAFEDFYEYLIQSELICSKEETLREIERLSMHLAERETPPPRIFSQTDRPGKGESCLIIPGCLPYGLIHLTSDEIRPHLLRLRLRQPNTGCLSGLNGLEHPCHVPAKDAHDLQALLILFHILRALAVNHIPILGRHHGHLGYHEIFIQLVQGSRGSGPSGGCHRGSRLMGGGAAS